MGLISESVVGKVFENLSEAFRTPPGSFAEYEKLVCSAAGDFFRQYGVFKLEYGLTLSSQMKFMEDVPEDTVIFGEDNFGKMAFRSDYSYPIAEGEAHFRATLSKQLSEDEDRTLEVVIRQLFFILQAMVLNLSYSNLLMNDYKMGITNVDGFMSFAEKLIAKGEIGNYTAVYFNIRNFKSVHKELSYSEGNEVLAEYCLIVSNAVLKREIVSRLGGDAFMALVLDENRDYFIDLIQNMVVSYESGNGKVYSFKFGATIGASILTDADNSGEIMMQVSTAYQYARERREVLGYYNPALREEIFTRRSILSKFPDALHNGEFYTMYQPKVSAVTHEIIGAEALVRWWSDGGCVMPDSFISILEADGCITSLDFYILEQVCRLISFLLKQNIEPVKVSVNFSKRHLTNNKLVEEIMEVIDRYKVPHKYIEVELTEGEDFHNDKVMKTVVDDLGNFGIKTSIDDFGTGYSSLSMLRTIAIDVLKIDKSFIPKPPIDTGCRSYLMLQGVVALAKSLGLTIVAEGVETKEQLDIIESMGCDMIQGYIFDKPLSEEEFIERIKQKHYTLSN